ncbi:MAG: LolA family protein [Haliscomenobacter sp.]
MMKYLCITFFYLCCFIPALNAQAGDPGTQLDSDPKAKALLDRLRKKYESYPSLEAEFSMSIELPEQPKSIQKGKLQQKGAKYRLEFNGQTVLSDGKSLWIILPKNKEVQINNLPDADEDDAILSPQSLFRIYERENFAYALVNEYSDGSRTLQEIEFKPLDKYSEYSKLRLTVNKANTDFVEMKAFAKDGARYTMGITRLTPNKPFPETTFAFNKTAYPGYHIEDLRN